MGHPQFNIEQMFQELFRIAADNSCTGASATADTLTFAISANYDAYQKEQELKREIQIKEAQILLTSAGYCCQTPEEVKTEKEKQSKAGGGSGY